MSHGTIGEHAAGTPAQNQTADGYVAPVEQRGVMSGWVIFAGTFLGLASLFSIAAGISGLVNRAYFDTAGLLYHNFTVASWSWIGIGALQLLAAMMIFARVGLGRRLGLLLASLSALAWMLAIGAYPLWGLIVLTADALVIYGLAAHGAED
jgi:hypothetical protein